MLVLASRSPRRQDILRSAGIPFVVRPADVDETPLRGEAAEDLVRRLARAKARAIEPADGEVVLGADTAVVAQGETLAKPENAEDARRMWRLLAGHDCTTITGICLRDQQREIVDLAASQLRFVRLSEHEIDTYIASQEWQDKAGAYAIQGLASKFVERISPDFFNIMGLPVALVYKHLRAWPGFAVP
ncbi:MAG: septum formation protein Maf [Chloroflexi bacterium]|nr:septum formation protein Maf [Chloroflexota bacterium]